MNNKELEKEIKILKAKFEALENHLKVESWTEEDDGYYHAKTFKKNKRNRSVLYW